MLISSYLFAFSDDALITSVSIQIRIHSILAKVHSIHCQALTASLSGSRCFCHDPNLFHWSLLGLGSEHSKSVFQLLTKVKALPALEGHSDMVKWILQVSS